MEFYLTKLISTMLLPPGILILLAVSGLIVVLYKKVLGIKILGVTIVLWYVLSIPVTADSLMGILQTHPALTQTELDTLAQQNKVDAIVVLGGGRYKNAPEYGSDTISNFTMERIRYGAHLYRVIKRPVVVSGGKFSQTELSEAQLMKETLEVDFKVPVSFTEDESKTTYENAKYTAEILRRNNLNSVLLVTHAYHMPRAVTAFESFNIRTVAAPTIFYGTDESGLQLKSILPNFHSQYAVSRAFHEILGSMWYRLRYY